jgi:hypothetical protein
MTGPRISVLSADQEAQLNRLVSLRDQLRSEQAQAMTPAVARFLELPTSTSSSPLPTSAITDQLFPEESP